MFNSDEAIAKWASVVESGTSGSGSSPRLTGQTNLKPMANWSRQPRRPNGKQEGRRKEEEGREETERSGGMDRQL